MKVGYLITARLKSTRLPEKLLREVQGRPIFAHMLDRLKLSRRTNQIIVCTSTNSQDDRLEHLAYAEEVSCFRGDEDDVLKRLHDASTLFNLDYILNITADCPFVDPLYADKIVETFETTGVDLIRALDLPHGAYSYGIKPIALTQVLQIKDDINTEVWGRYFTDTDLFQVYDLEIENPIHRQPGLRMTLDYPEDLEFFKAVFAALYQPGQVFSLDEILHFLAQHPEVVEINRHCALAYKKRWTRQSDIRLKTRYSVQRAAIVGSGSIGQRHIRNLHALGISEIYTLRSHKGHFTNLDPGLGIQEVQDWQTLIDVRPDIAIVSNPTSLHLDAVFNLLPYVRGLFIEKPLSSSMEGVSDFLEQVKKYRVVTFVGYNLQFHPVIKTIQTVLDGESLGRPLLFQCQVGQWLPGWHPYEDHRQAYYARKDLGGGVSLTLSHELHLALQLFGPAQSITCLLNRSEALPLEVDVIADMMIQHQTGAVSQVHLDYLQRPIHRQGVISCEKGWLTYDLVQPFVKIQAEEDPEPGLIWDASDYNPNDHYVDEMNTFLQVVREGRYRHPYDAWHGARSLALVMSAFESAQTGRLVSISEVL